MKKIKPTKNGVIYDIEHSSYISERHGLAFHFSSMSHKEKFDSEVYKKEEWLCDSLSRRFKIKIEARVLAALQLYMQIESRGFYVIDSEGEYKCLDDVIFHGDVYHKQDCENSLQGEMLY